MLAKNGVEAVAICFLHSYQDPADEIRMADILREVDAIEVHHACRTRLSRRSGEYERISTTALNAYIGPRTSKYVSNLETLLEHDGFGGRLLIMQSNGGLMSADTAKRVPVAMMESGPVGGVIAAARDQQPISATKTRSPSTWAAPPPRPAWCTAASRRSPKAITSAVTLTAIRP